MRQSTLMIASIDLLLCFLVLFLLSFFAAFFDEQRGLGDLDFSLVEFAPTRKGDVDGSVWTPSFVAVVIEHDALTLYDYQEGVTNVLRRLQSPNDLTVGDVVSKDAVYVIFEKEPNNLLAGTIRTLLQLGVRVGVARTAGDEK